MASVGDLRFRLPVPHGPYNGTFNATSFGISCPQQIGLTLQENLTDDTIAFFTGTAPSPVIPESEDCMHSSTTLLLSLNLTFVGLTINVWQPAGVTPGAKLPVVAVSDLEVVLENLISSIIL